MISLGKRGIPKSSYLVSAVSERLSPSESCGCELSVCGGEGGTCWMSGKWCIFKIPL